ncbi:MAG: DUF134 domain-containing protein [Methanobacteriaceae archaeon]|nr:DUF134 domain-containing protein [Methanobacteriaceae archaeon]
MVRPKIKRTIGKNPEQICFNQNTENKLSPLEMVTEEYEAIRLKDYHNFNQKQSAELMEVSQPTFHRILNSARKKIAKSLIEGRKINIIGVTNIKNQITYYCKTCGFQWSNQQKKYTKCPDCNSSEIVLLENDSIEKRKSYGGKGRGIGKPPSACVCPKCGYEAPKIMGEPCRNTKCPECGTPLHGSGRCVD